MLVIRLSRIGRKDKAVYRIVVSENTKDTHGDSLEQLGFYNPGVTPKEIKFEKERILHWISMGAKSSPTVNNLLIDGGIIEGKKMKASRGKKVEATETPVEALKAPAKVEEKPQAEVVPETPAVEVEATPEAPVENIEA
ncbi:MAG: 30S ribosomal protein S16 [Patescibacteria group bacterium]